MQHGVFSLSLYDAHGNLRSFVAGEENCALQLLPQFVEMCAAEQQPIVLWGMTGIGKTWLSVGFMGWRKKEHPTEKMVYVTGVDFARQFADAIDTSTIDTFRQTYRQTHFIVVDGIQHLQEKPAAAREFCALLDHRQKHGMGTLVTSSISPAEISIASLQSRLCGGLSLKIHAPEPATQLVLLAYFAHELDFDLSENLITYLQMRLELLETTPLTPRKLQASVKQLLARCQFLTSELSTETIDAVFPPATQGTFDLKKLLALVAKRFKVTITELRSSSRKHSLVRARGVLALLARYLNNCSYGIIGQELGNRDHSTMHHAVEKVCADLEEDLSFRAFVEQLKEDAQKRFNIVKPSQVWLGKLVAPLSENVAQLQESDNATPLLF
jgi:chromosomal replication initiator protein